MASIVNRKRWIRRGGTLPRLLGLAVLLALTALKYTDPLPLERLRHAVFDRYLAAKPRPVGDLPVVIVDIDDRSLQALGQWPWSRAVLARLVDRLQAAGAATIGFDIMFPEPDRLSPARLARSLPGLTAEMRARLEAEPDTDRLLAEAIGRARVVLGRSGLGQRQGQSAEGQGAEDPPVPLAMIGGDSTDLLPAYPDMVRNLPVLEAPAAGLGLFSVLPEADGIIRRVPTAFAIGGQVRPALAVETLRVATGGDALAIRRDSAGISGLVIGGHLLPTERDGRLWVHYTPHQPARFVSAVDVLEERYPPERFRNRIVLIGTSAVGLQDLRPTPLEPAMPGVEIHAQVLETILAGAVLIRPNYALGAEVLAGAALAGLIILLVPVLGPLPVLGLGLALASLTLWLAWMLFARHGVLIDPVYPLVTGFAVYVTLVFANYWREQRQKDAIRSAFQHYLAPSLVERMVRQPELLTLGGETRMLTILFSDVRGFTSVAESYQEDPQALTALMNRLLSPLSEAIIAEGGTIDKYMGDAIMAFWNAPLDMPDHAARALRAAREMRRRHAQLEAERQREAEAAGRPYLPLEIGIGINSGRCVVGNMGSQARFDYTALGDAVNLASRLEGLTARYGRPILIGEASAALLPPEDVLEPVDRVTVKGKHEPTQIFAPVG
ncbi:MAG: adenylate/guanylate cyclase domain-containing protein [Beijerinckiaceae bacterium]|nr:adenylate/guanylate cyclase domain-containing protein [Beijerinckiaceae bacterium]MCZ8301318.1 adenylate/guanylate cyclase domain-containing protein [Beijerinckiaceae bacterium]